MSVTSAKAQRAANSRWGRERMKNRTFLAINGIWISASEDRFNLVIQVATSGLRNRDEIAEQLDTWG